MTDEFDPIEQDDDVADSAKPADDPEWAERDDDADALPEEDDA
jgi:hypothetical protein